MTDPTAAGWPRKRLEYLEDEAPLPNVYVGGENQLKGDWSSFDVERSSVCLRDRLCAVCGEPLRSLTLYGALDRGGFWADMREKHTNGPGAHPRCFAMALRFCPHFTGYDDKAVVAYLYDKPRHGFKVDAPYDEPSYPVFKRCRNMTRPACIELAKRSPLGDDL